MHNNWSPQNNQSLNRSGHQRNSFTSEPHPYCYNASPSPGFVNRSFSSYPQVHSPMRPVTPSLPVHPYDMGSSPRMSIGRGLHSLGNLSHSTPHDRGTFQYLSRSSSIITDSFNSTQNCWDSSRDQFSNSTPQSQGLSKYKRGNFRNKQIFDRPVSVNNLPNCLKDPWHHLTPTPAPPGQKSLISRAGQRHSFLTPQKAVEAISSKLEDIGENLDLPFGEDKAYSNCGITEELKSEYEPSKAYLDCSAPKLRPAINLPSPKCSSDKVFDEDEPSPQYNPTPITKDSKLCPSLSVPTAKFSDEDEDESGADYYTPAATTNNEGMSFVMTGDEKKNSSIIKFTPANCQSYCLPNFAEECNSLSATLTTSYNPIIPDLNEAHSPPKKSRLTLNLPESEESQNG